MSPRPERTFVYELPDEQQAEIREKLLANELTLKRVTEKYHVRHNTIGMDIKCHLGVGAFREGQRHYFRQLTMEEQEEAKAQWPEYLAHLKAQQAESNARARRGEPNKVTGKPRVPSSVPKKQQQELPVPEPITTPPDQKVGIDEVVAHGNPFAPDPVYATPVDLDDTELALWNHAQQTIERLLNANVQLAEHADITTEKFKQLQADYDRLHAAYANLDTNAHIWKRDSEAWHQELHRRKQAQAHVSKSRLQDLLERTEEHLAMQARRENGSTNDDEPVTVVDLTTVN